MLRVMKWIGIGIVAGLCGLCVAALVFGRGEPTWASYAPLAILPIWTGWKLWGFYDWAQDARHRSGTTDVETQSMPHPVEDEDKRWRIGQ